MRTRIDIVPKLAFRARNLHNGSFGSVLVARAALRGGAGLVRAATTVDRDESSVVLHADVLNVLEPWTGGRHVAPAVMTPLPGKAAQLSEPGFYADDLSVAITVELARFIGPAQSIESRRAVRGDGRSEHLRSVGAPRCSSRCWRLTASRWRRRAGRSG